MDTSVMDSTALAYDDRGAGFPVVFLHGLTFSKLTWRPIIDCMADRFRCVAIDLPGHGESAGPPRPMEEVVDEIHRLLTDLGISRPVLVGHSLAGILATVYASRYSVAGAVNVDQPLDVEPFVRMVRQLEPALRGPDFSTVFEPIRQSIGVEMLPEPLRTGTQATQTIRQDLILGYWNDVLQQSPEDLQALTDETARKIKAPYLAIFGRQLPDDERARLQARVSALQLEEWPDRGHMVHLMEPDRFADRLAAFVLQCNAGRESGGG